MIHVLVVEDDALMAELMERFLEPLKPDKVTRTNSLKKAIEIVNTDPPPDACLMDLKLISPDGVSDVHDVLNIIPVLQERTQVAIVTGFPRDAIGVSVPILSKDEFLGKKLWQAVVRMLLNGPWSRAEANLERMKELETQLANVHQG